MDPSDIIPGITETMTQERLIDGPSPGISPQPLNLKRIGRFEIVYTLGTGGMASVYVGRLVGPAKFTKLVAIKVIHPHLADHKKFVEMFLDEARLASMIHHPYVGEVFEIGKEKNLFYMVSEFIPSQQLGRVVKKLKSTGRLLPQEMVAFIGSKILEALRAAHDTTNSRGHKLGLVHRDITPSNVLVSYDGYVKLIDFGIAWAKERITETETGTLKGKMGFMSPEQILGLKVDNRSDIFSAGISLYIMATGKHPYVRKTEAQQMGLILEGKVTPPTKYRSDLHPELNEIILKALQREPADRFQNAAEMSLVLERLAWTMGQPNVGSQKLAGLMRGLFKEEIERHWTQMGEHRGDDSVVFDVEKEVKSLGARPSKVSLFPPAPTRSFLPLILAVLIVMLFGGILLAWFIAIKQVEEKEAGQNSKPTYVISAQPSSPPKPPPKGANQ